MEGRIAKAKWISRRAFQDCVSWLNQTGPDRSALIERHIDEYLKAAPFSLTHELERLRRAIQNEEAQRRQGEDWSPARDYIRLLLHSMV
jgi:hypothetical protein